MTRLLKGGQVVTLDARNTLHPTADILVEHGRIAAIAPRIAAPADAEVVDLAGCIVLPGFVDTHRHSWQTGIRGVAADWSLHEYVRNIRMGYARVYRPEDVFASTLVGLLEALDSGITTLCDFCHIVNSPAHADAALDAIRAAGLRVRLYYGFYDVPLVFRPERWAVTVAAAVGAVVYAVDVWDAFPEKALVERAAEAVHPAAGETVWYTGHWGFQYYAERHGMRAIEPTTRFRAGDWLVLPVPDGSFGRPAGVAPVALPPPLRLEPVAELTWDDRYPARTVPELYGGAVPMKGGEGPRLRVVVGRVTAD